MTPQQNERTTEEIAHDIVWPYRPNLNESTRLDKKDCDGLQEYIQEALDSERAKRSELEAENLKMKQALAWADEELSRLKSGKESQLLAEIESLKAQVAEAKDADVSLGVIRMENKKIGGVLADICKLLKDSGVEKKYFDQADLEAALAKSQEDLKWYAEVHEPEAIKLAVAHSQASLSLAVKALERITNGEHVVETSNIASVNAILTLVKVEKIAREALSDPAIKKEVERMGSVDAVIEAAKKWFPSTIHGSNCSDECVALAEALQELGGGE